ncbi:Acetylcholinesterase-like protein, partial [Dinothrombium tinctorium]
VSKIGQDAIIFEYTDWVNVEDKIKNRDAIDKAVGDFAFSCHAIEIAYRYALSGQDVYSYYFTHRSSVSPWPQWMGVLHADEINFIFGEPLDPRFGYNAAEIELSKRMMRYWANFAKTGNPNMSKDGKMTSIYWPEHSRYEREYLTLAPNNSTIGKGPRSRQCAFWLEYLPNLIKETHCIRPECLP